MQPLGATGLSDPHDFVCGHGLACGGGERALAHLRHLGPGVQVHAPLGQHAGEVFAHPGVVRGHHLRPAGEEVKHQIVGVAAQGFQLGAQAELHGQRQLHAARATAHQRDGGAAGVLAHALQQRQPAGVEIQNGFDRYRVLGRTGHTPHLGGGAHVDATHIKPHRRMGAAQHFAVGGVQAHHLVVVKTRPGKHGQARQVNVAVVKAIVPRDVAGQHAGVRCVNAVADDGQAHTGLGVHAKAAQHAHMAVATAYQHDVAQHGLVRGLHSGLSQCVISSATRPSSARRSAAGANRGARTAHWAVRRANRPSDCPWLARTWRSRPLNPAASPGSKYPL